MPEEHESVFNTPIRNVFEDMPDEDNLQEAMRKAASEQHLIKLIESGRAKIVSKQRGMSSGGRPSTRITIEYEE